MLRAVCTNYERCPSTCPGPGRSLDSFRPRCARGALHVVRGQGLDLSQGQRVRDSDSRVISSVSDPHRESAIASRRPCSWLVRAARLRESPSIPHRADRRDNT